MCILCCYGESICTELAMGRGSVGFGLDVFLGIFRVVVVQLVGFGLLRTPDRHLAGLEVDPVTAGRVTDLLARGLQAPLLLVHMPLGRVEERVEAPLRHGALPARLIQRGYVVRTLRANVRRGRKPHVASTPCCSPAPRPTWSPPSALWPAATGTRSP